MLGKPRRLEPTPDHRILKDLQGRLDRSLALLNEPPQLDSTRQTDVTSSMIVGHVMEGLTRYGTKGEILPGVAEKWEVKPTGAVSVTPEPITTCEIDE